jgi:hypothetical protein
LPQLKSEGGEPSAPATPGLILLSYTTCWDAAQESVGSRYLRVNIRTLVNPGDPADVVAAHALQDAVRVKQSSPGNLVLPDWDQQSLGALRRAILGLGGAAVNGLCCSST